MKKHTRAELDLAVSEAVQIEPLALEEEFQRLPADLARYNELYARSLRRFLLAKARVDRVWSQVYLELRESGDKMSEATLKAEVTIDDRYTDALNERIDAEVEKARLNGVVDAIMAKKDSIISMGAHIRAEMGGSPRARQDHTGARDVERSKSHNAEDEE